MVLSALFNLPKTGLHQWSCNLVIFLFIYLLFNYLIRTTKHKIAALWILSEEHNKKCYIVMNTCFATKLQILIVHQLKSFADVYVIVIFFKQEVCQRA